MAFAKPSLALLASLTLLCLIPGTASAATEFGGNCTGDAGAPNQTLLQIVHAPGSPLPLAAPASGVITKWKVNFISAPVTVPSQLKVFRPTANPKEFLTVGESTTSSVASGANSFATQIPVEAGDLLGLVGMGTVTLYCKEEGPGNRVAGISGNPGVGSTATVGTEVDEVAMPVAAVIEPDADKDGFGDETQDKCPQSAAIQALCPTLSLDVFGLAGRKAVSVLVAASIPAPVSVQGTVKLPATRKAHRSAVVRLTAPGKSLAPGTIAIFKLKLTTALKAALTSMPKSKSLKLTVTASGTNAAGAVTTDSFAVRLRGRG